MKGELTIKKGDTIDYENALWLFESLGMPVFETQGDRRVVTGEGERVARKIEEKEVTYDVLWVTKFMDTWKELAGH